MPLPNRTLPKLLQVPNDPRFVHAIAMATEPGNTLAILLAIGAIRAEDMAIVPRIQKMLDKVYTAASDLKDWEIVNLAGVLINALSQPDHQAYLAYHQDTALTALATIYSATWLSSSHRRPWEEQPHKRAEEALWRIARGEATDNLLPSPGNPT